MLTRTPPKGKKTESSASHQGSRAPSRANSPSRLTRIVTRSQSRSNSRSRFEESNDNTQPPAETTLTRESSPETAQETHTSPKHFPSNPSNYLNPSLLQSSSSNYLNPSLLQSSSRRETIFHIPNTAHTSLRNESPPVDLSRDADTTVMADHDDHPLGLNNPLIERIRELTKKHDNVQNFIIGIEPLSADGSNLARWKIRTSRAVWEMTGVEVYWDAERPDQQSPVEMVIDRCAARVINATVCEELKDLIHNITLSHDAMRTIEDLYCAGSATQWILHNGF